MANPKDLGSREVLLTEENWRIVRVSWRDIEGKTAPYIEHSCDDCAGWMWFRRALNNHIGTPFSMACGNCNQQPPDGMVVMLRFLRDNEG